MNHLQKRIVTFLLISTCTIGSLLGCAQSHSTDNGHEKAVEAVSKAEMVEETSIPLPVNEQNEWREIETDMEAYFDPEKQREMDTMYIAHSADVALLDVLLPRQRILSDTAKIEIDDPSIVTVDENYHLKGHKVGETKMHVTSGDERYTVFVHVEDWKNAG